MQNLDDINLYLYFATLYNTCCILVAFQQFNQILAEYFTEVAENFADVVLIDSG